MDHNKRIIGATFLLLLLVSWPLYGQQTATFSLRFESTWSASTHPTGFPSNPHYSGLIGTTHNNAVSFWAVGQNASEGIKNMAETGSKSALQSLLNDSEDAGSSDIRISEGGLGTSPDSRNITFFAHQSHPLLTLVSMLAPSPDWFVGVSGLQLRDSQGWISSQEVELFVYDAGTDSGSTYATSNQATIPPVPVSRLEEGPIQVNGSARSVGKFVIELMSVTGMGPEVQLPSKSNISSIYPNPFASSLQIEVSVEQSGHAEIVAFDVLGRQIDVIFAGTLLAGENHLTWASNISPQGVYVIQLKTVEGTSHVRVVKG